MGTSLQGGRRLGWITSDSQASRVLTLLLPSVLWSSGTASAEPSSKELRQIPPPPAPPPAAKRRLPRCPTSPHSPSYLCFTHACFLSSQSGIPIHTFRAATFISCQIHPPPASPTAQAAPVWPLFSITSRVGGA